MLLNGASLSPQTSYCVTDTDSSFDVAPVCDPFVFEEEEASGVLEQRPSFSVSRFQRYRESFFSLLRPVTSFANKVTTTGFGLALSAQEVSARLIKENPYRAPYLAKPVLEKVSFLEAMGSQETFMLCGAFLGFMVFGIGYCMGRIAAKADWDIDFDYTESKQKVKRWMSIVSNWEKNNINDWQTMNDEDEGSLGDTEIQGTPPKEVAREAVRLIAKSKPGIHEFKMVSMSPHHKQAGLVTYYVKKASHPFKSLDVMEPEIDELITNLFGKALVRTHPDEPGVAHIYPHPKDEQKLIIGVHMQRTMSWGGQNGCDANFVLVVDANSPLIECLRFGSFTLFSYVLRELGIALNPESQPVMEQFVRKINFALDFRQEYLALIKDLSEPIKFTTLEGFYRFLIQKGFRRRGIYENTLKLYNTSGDKRCDSALHVWARNTLFHRRAGLIPIH